MDCEAPNPEPVLPKRQSRLLGRGPIGHGRWPLFPKPDTPQPRNVGGLPKSAAPSPDAKLPQGTRAYWTTQR
jgi:hypothetical protein